MPKQNIGSLCVQQIEVCVQTNMAQTKSIGRLAQTKSTGRLAQTITLDAWRKQIHEKLGSNKNIGRLAQTNGR